MGKAFNLAIVTSQLYNENQSELLNNILNCCTGFGINTSVISNVYNFESLVSEDEIYELILCEDLDAIAVITEYLKYDKLKEDIKNYILKSGKKTVIIGSDPVFKNIPNALYSDESNCTQAIASLCESDINSYGKPENGNLFFSSLKNLEKIEYFIQLEQCFMNCMSIEDFMRTMCESIYQTGKENDFDIFLCLYREWWSSEKNPTMFGYNIKNENELFTFNANTLPDKVSDGNKHYICFYTPIFFSENMSGYIIFRCSKPFFLSEDYCHWLKNISFALQFQKARYDVSIMADNKTISRYYDKVTNFLSLEGLKFSIESFISDKESSDCIYTFMIKIPFTDTGLQPEQIKENMTLVSSVAESITPLMNDNTGFFSRVDENTFIFAKIGQQSSEYPENTVDLIKTLIMSNYSFIEKMGAESLFIAHKQYYKDNISADRIIEELNAMIDPSIKKLEESIQNPKYSSISKIRKRLYINSERNADINNVCKELCLGVGYFRNQYKYIFETSFHKDCLNAKMYLAKHLLVTTTTGISYISEKCGFNDEKYFIRLFKKNTSYSPVQYREMFYIS